MTYATDTDLLHWEPSIFKDATIPSQTLLAGNGDLSGTSFTISSGSFVTAGVEPGHVITIAGTINGSFPVIAVYSATSLTLSVLYDRLTPDEGAVDARPIGTASNVPFTIKTCKPQISLVGELLQQMIDVSHPVMILNPQVLRRPAVLGTLQLLYAASAAVVTDEPQLSIRAEMYERSYRRALRGAKIEIDLNADGKRDVVRCPAFPRFHRT